MLIGTLQVEVLIHSAYSLKEKRFVLKSLKEHLRNQFNVSVAEVDYLDKWQRSVLGFACVSNERRFLDSVLSKLLNALIQDGRVEVIDQVIEIF